MRVSQNRSTRLYSNTVSTPHLGAEHRLLTIEQAPLHGSVPICSVPTTRIWSVI